MSWVRSSTEAAPAAGGRCGGVGQGRGRSGAGSSCCWGDLLPSSRPHPSAPSSSLCRAAHTESFVRMRGQAFLWSNSCSGRAMLPVLYSAAPSVLPSPHLLLLRATGPDLCPCGSFVLLPFPSHQTAPCSLRVPSGVSIQLLFHSWLTLWSLKSILYRSIYTPEQGIAQQHIHTPWNCLPRVPFVPVVGCSCVQGQKPFSVNLLKPQSHWCTPAITAAQHKHIFFLSLSLAKAQIDLFSNSSISLPSAGICNAAIMGIPQKLLLCIYEESSHG